MEENGRREASPSFKEFLFSFLSPQRCRACRAVLSFRATLCKRCEREYHATLAWECGLCGLPPAYCTCTGEYLARARIRRHIKLFRYKTDALYPVANSLIYYLKRASCRRVLRFFTEQLVEAVRRHLPDYREFFLCAAPRTPRERRRYGFDHSKALGRALARKLGIPYRACLTRARGAKRQKELTDPVSRLRNALSTVRLRKRPPMRRALVLDDLVTTGATVVACARMLRKNGVREVVAVSLAYVARNPNLKYEERNRVP